MRKPLPALICSAWAGCIFVLDTFTPFEFSVAVLYVLAVLIAATYLSRRAVLAAAACCTALTLVSLVLVHHPHFPGTALLRAAISIAAIGITTFLVLLNRATGERLRASERQRANLARFFSPSLVDELADMEEPLSLTRSQSAAVMFVDVVGFTAHSARMTPEEVIVLLRDLLALLSRCVFTRNGIIDKFLGDGLMAVFGPPLPSAHDATNALRCGFDILEAVAAWNVRRGTAGEATIEVAVGIHYGAVVQGDIGSDDRLELTVVGDTVNIASRVETCCRTLGVGLLATAALVEAIGKEGDAGCARILVDLGEHTLRGRVEPTRLYGFGVREGGGGSRTAEDAADVAPPPTTLQAASPSGETKPAAFR